MYQGRLEKESRIGCVCFLSLEGWDMRIGMRRLGEYMLT